MFQPAPHTEEELAACAPVDLTPEEVQNFDEAEWYARAYQGDKPQLTLRAVAMGSVLGFFLSFTNIYIGLKTGWFLGVALTACILSYAFWNALRAIGFAKSPMTILENNCMQSTASSAGYATGNIFVSAVPAMLLLSVNEAHPGGVQQSPWVLGAWTFFLAILGVTLAIPFKRSMINQERLKFPSGTAAAVTLRGIYSQGAEALAKARALGLAALVGGLLKLATDLEFRKTVVDGVEHKAALLPSTAAPFDWLKGLVPAGLREKMGIFHSGGKEWNLSDWTLRMDFSAVLVAAGAIVGLRTTLSMVVSGLFLAFVIGPHALDAEFTNAAGRVVHAASRPGAAWKEIGLWLGAPLIVAYSLTSFGAQWRTIARAFGGLTKKTVEASPYRQIAADGRVIASPTEVEVPKTWFVAGLGIATVGLVVLAWRFFEIPPLYGVIAVAMTFVLGLVSCRATGETDITPGGAMGKIMQLTYGVLIPQSTTANLMTASITSGAGLAAADLLNDLKSGYLLGANPRRQFMAQAAGIVTGTVASVLGYCLLVPDASVFAGDNPQFAAPGAQQWKAAAELFMMGVGNLHPFARSLIVWGVAAGATLALAEVWLPRWRAKLPSATGLGLGLILPFSAPLAMFLGALLAWAIAKTSKSWAERFLVPLAAGTIAGESIVGVVVAGLNNFLL